jgi:hypothetical protein
MRHAVRLLIGLILALAYGPPAPAEGVEWEDLAVHNEVRLLRHTNWVTGRASCWAQAVFRAKPKQFYLIGIGFAPDGRFRFYLRLTDPEIWLGTSGHLLWLANGQRHVLAQTWLGGGGEGLTVPQPDRQDEIVRALIDDGRFALVYRTLDGAHRSLGDFRGLKPVLETAAQRCEDARDIRLQ